MQRMKNLLLVLGGTLDALFLKECYEKMAATFCGGCRWST